MARIIKKTNIRMADGSAAVLSTSEIASGEFETMLATPDFGTEYAVRRASTEAQALADHKHLRKQYHVPALSGKYAQLADDLRKAAEAARAAGVGFFVWNLWGSKSFVFPLRGVGQGNANTAAAEAMRDALKDMGYDAGMYYQID